MRSSGKRERERVDESERERDGKRDGERRDRKRETGGGGRGERGSVCCSFVQNRCHAVAEARIP